MTNSTNLLKNIRIVILTSTKMIKTKFKNGFTQDFNSKMRGLERETMQTSPIIRKNRFLRFLTIAFVFFFSLLVFFLALGDRNYITLEVAI